MVGTTPPSVSRRPVSGGRTERCLSGCGASTFPPYVGASSCSPVSSPNRTGPGDSQLPQLAGFAPRSRRRPPTRRSLGTPSAERERRPVTRGGHQPSADPHTPDARRWAYSHRGIRRRAPVLNLRRVRRARRAEGGPDPHGDDRARCTADWRSAQLRNERHRCDGDGDAAPTTPPKSPAPPRSGRGTTCWHCSAGRATRVPLSVSGSGCDARPQSNVWSGNSSGA
jgi:hypothetical protein